MCNKKELQEIKNSGYDYELLSKQAKDTEREMNRIIYETKNVLNSVLF